MRRELDPRVVSGDPRLDVASELARLVNTTFDLDEIFRTAVRQLRRVVEFRRASVALVSDDRNRYYLHTLYDAARDGFVEQEQTFPVAQGLTGQAIREEVAIRVDEFGGTEGIRAPGEGEVSALVIPLRVEDRVIGTLNLGAPDPVSYGDGELELAVLLARQIETSLGYSRLLSTIRQQREELARERTRLESERNRLEALVEATDTAVLMVSDGRVVHANRALGDLLGVPDHVLRGEPLKRVEEALSRAMTGSSSLAERVAAMGAGDAPARDRVEFSFPRRVVCQRTVAPVPGPGGRMLGQLVLFRDVTREAEVDRAKDEFVSLVSHELRTPLSSVKTSLTLLRDGAGGELDEGGRDLLETALRNLDRLIRLVNELLDLSRIESGEVVPEICPVSVESAARRAVEAVEGYARERDVALDRRSPGVPLRVRADPDRLEQVLVNLLSNGVKVSPPGGRVTIRWWEEAGEVATGRGEEHGDREAVCLEIADQGPGIPSHRREEIFHRFRQLDRSESRRHGGVGLGLAISRLLVEAFGGEIWAESEEGEGARFYVRLQRAGAPPEAK